MLFYLVSCSLRAKVAFFKWHWIVIWASSYIVLPWKKNTLWNNWPNGFTSLDFLTFFFNICFRSILTGNVGKFFDQCFPIFLLFSELLFSNSDIFLGSRWKIIDGTPGWFISYKEQGIVTFGGTLDTNYRQPSVSWHPGWESLSYTNHLILSRGFPTLLNSITLN